MTMNDKENNIDANSDDDNEINDDLMSGEQVSDDEELLAHPKDANHSTLDDEDDYVNLDENKFTVPYACTRPTPSFLRRNLPIVITGVVLICIYFVFFNSTTERCVLSEDNWKRMIFTSYVLIFQIFTQVIFFFHSNFQL